MNYPLAQYTKNDVFKKKSVMIESEALQILITWRQRFPEKLALIWVADSAALSAPRVKVTYSFRLAIAFSSSVCSEQEPELPMLLD